MKHFTHSNFTPAKHSNFIFIKIGTFLLALIPLLGFTENNDNKSDEYSPKIELYSPVQQLDVIPGKSINVSALLQDNLELDSYKINIIKGGSSSDRFAEAFSSYQDLDANGDALPMITGSKSFELNFSLKVNEKAIVGDYTFFLILKDKAGNEHVVQRFFNVCRH